MKWNRRLLSVRSSFEPVSEYQDYQENKNDILDGQRVYEDIAFFDSLGQTFYAIPDGSYLFIKSGKEELRGEAYRISEGKMSQIAQENDIITL